MRTVKNAVRFATASTPFAVLVRLLEYAPNRRVNLLRVLTYHRVDDPARRGDLFPGLISTSPAGFGEQVQWLAENCRVVSLDDVLDAAEGGSPLPPRSVLITFDDAYDDFALFAWPVLKQHRLPCVLFVPTAFPGSDRTFWWDRLYCAFHRSEENGCLVTPWGKKRWNTFSQRDQTLRTIRQHVKETPHNEAMLAVIEICEQLGGRTMTNAVLGWEELRRLAGEGVTMAPHTRTHPLLQQISLDAAAEEASDSLKDLQEHIGQTPAVLAYPSGGYNLAVAQKLKQHGFRLAFTTRRGINDLAQCDPLQMRRINIGQTTSLALMRAQLLPGVRVFNRMW